jgi:hypothetical protein
MESSWIYGLWLAAGVVLGLVFFRLARRLGPRGERAVLALALLIVAAVYPALAAGAGAEDWLVPEIVAALAIAALAVLGWAGSPLWLSGGWALHAAWDSPVHLVSSAAAFVPEAYVLACVGFDVVLAAAIYLRYRRYGRDALAADA